MKIFGVCIICFGALNLLLSGVFFVIYRIFEHHKAMTAKVTASLQETKYKKDVPVYGGRHHLRVVMILKNWCRGTYKYTVNDKRYKIRYIQHVTRRQMPKMISVIYLKRFPRIAYVKDDVMDNMFWINSFVCFVISVLFFLAGIEVIVGLDQLLH